MFIMKVLILLSYFVNVCFGYRQVCYHTNWSQYRPGEGKFTPSDIDPFLCTHLVYAFAGIKNNQLSTVEWNDEKLYADFNKLKASNPELKTLLAVGGWTQDSTYFSPMVTDPDTRALFVRTTVTFLRRHGFDGLDLDWEYPGKRDSMYPNTDMDNFVLLCKELKEEFQKEALSTGRSRLLVTAAVAAGKGNIDGSYDVPNLARYLDFISIMTYDFHGAWSSVTGLNSPLEEKPPGDQHNTEWAATYWENLGAPKSILNIGLATYGRGFTLVNPSQHGIGSLASGPNVAGRFTGTAGFLSYYEICDEASKAGKVERDGSVPYYVNGDQWIGFDDEQSLRTKVNWLKNKGYGGAMVWALPLDDFSGYCSTTTNRYPLVRAIKDEFMKSGTSSTSAATNLPSTGVIPVVTSDFTTTTAVPKQVISCVGRTDGFYSHPTDCSHFFRCVMGQIFSMSCQYGLSWNQKLKVCDWPSNVDCKAGPRLPPTSQTDSTSRFPSTTQSTVQSTTVPQQATTVPSKPTINPSVTPQDFNCSGKLDGNYPHDTDCGKFYVCVNKKRVEFSCSYGLHWNQQKVACDWPSNVSCTSRVL